MQSFIVCNVSAGAEYLFFHWIRCLLLLRFDECDEYENGDECDVDGDECVEFLVVVVVVAVPQGGMQRERLFL